MIAALVLAFVAQVAPPAQTGQAAPESPATLLRCIETYLDVDRRLTQVGVYASMNYDLDTRVGRSQQMQEQARQAGTAFSAASAWVRPEILAAGPDRVHALVAGEPRLAPYAHPLDDIVRRAPHRR